MPTRHQLALDIVPLAPHRATRRVRRPFTPDTSSGRYTLPRGLADGLTVALAGYRNRDAAIALAVFLARWWGAPGRHRQAFHIDRRALAGNAMLGLTEARIRGALATLERVGYLDRMPVIGRTHQARAGELHRKPSTFRFGAHVLGALDDAHARQARARQRRRRPTPHQTPTGLHRPSTTFPRPPVLGLTSPKNTSLAELRIHLGEVAPYASRPRRSALPSLPRTAPAQTAGPSNVDVALARLAAARCARAIGGLP